MWKAPAVYSTVHCPALFLGHGMCFLANSSVSTYDWQLLKSGGWMLMATATTHS